MKKSLKPSMSVVALSFLFHCANANAKASDWVNNLTGETSVITGKLMIIFGAAGIVIVGLALFSFLAKKKQPGGGQGNSWEGWGMLVGVLLLLLVPFVNQLGESVSGDANSVDTEAVFNFSES